MNMTKLFISLSSHFKLCVAAATHNSKWLTIITNFCSIWDICKYVSTRFIYNGLYDWWFILCTLELLVIEEINIALYLSYKLVYQHFS